MPEQQPPASFTPVETDFISLYQSVQSHLRPVWYEKSNPTRLISRRTFRRIKRIFDLILAWMLLPVAVPILAICWVAIRLESAGPAFFCQERTGRDGRRFKMFKLRTMVADAEELKDEFRDLNELAFPDFKISDDPRVTKVGHILRKTSLDELPQIFNIIRGDMSFVGPRPTSFPASTYRLWQTARLEATPGLTGLWQVLARGEVEFEQRLRLDIAYIRNQCLTLDLQILFRTIAAVCQGRGAK